MVVEVLEDHKENNRSFGRYDKIRALSPENFLAERRDAKLIVEGLPFLS